MLRASKGDSPSDDEGVMPVSVHAGESTDRKRDGRAQEVGEVNSRCVCPPGQDQ